MDRELWLRWGQEGVACVSVEVLPDLGEPWKRVLGWELHPRSLCGGCKAVGKAISSGGWFHASTCLGQRVPRFLFASGSVSVGVSG